MNCFDANPIALYFLNTPSKILHNTAASSSPWKGLNSSEDKK